MKNMNYGRITGLSILFVGIMFSLLGLFMLTETGSIFVIFYSAPILFFWGIAFLIFPGTQKTMEEVNGNFSVKEMLRDANLRQERQARQLGVLKEAPGAHKLAWGISIAIGSVITLVLVLQSGIF